MSSWHSYPKLFAIGHPAVQDIFTGEVLVEEKVDGSQFSFGKINGELRIRSKGKEILVDNPEKMFLKGIKTAQDLFPQLKEGHTYRGEFLSKPKHNALAYEYEPACNVIIFDTQSGEEQYLSYDEKVTEATRLGLQVVPMLYKGKIDKPEMLLELLDNISVLGGQKIEWVVVKAYDKFGEDKKALMAKYVSEEFKEVHNGERKKSNPTQGDFIKLLAASYRTPARWNKAIQHLRERGELTDSPKDIGKLMKETQLDIHQECEAEIKEKLWQHFWGEIGRTSVHGLPDYYKKYLLEKNFTNE